MLELKNNQRLKSTVNICDVTINYWEYAVCQQITEWKVEIM